MTLIQRTVKTIEEFTALVQNKQLTGYRTLLRPDESGYVVWRADNRDTIKIKDEENFEIDGGFVSIYGNAFELKNCKDFKLKRMTIRLGSIGFDENTFNDMGRPSPLGLENCKRGKIERCHFAWGMDENLSVKSSREIEIDYCLTSEPLDNPWDSTSEPDHAFNALLKGSEVTLEHCLLVGGRNRNPSVAAKGDYCPDVDVRYCVIHDFKEVGAKYNAGKDCSGEHKYRIRDCYYVRDGDDSSLPNPITPMVIDKPEKGALRLISNRNRLYEWKGSDLNDRTANAYWGNDNNEPPNNGDKMDPGTKNDVEYSRVKGQPEIYYKDIIEAAGTGRAEDEVVKEEAANHQFHALINSETESLFWNYYSHSVPALASV